ncbi:MAG: hypothetical protein EZS28_031815 [Streblomastix strix]|uniref:Uncharacterized protein n=1 Tax=Streblomastix strix TaxID=222440 RepID=A0A5J4UQA1_9EUKA|nr:MAG: hypothetical protein EZS28_031815 [Streblomastix strix]
MREKHRNKGQTLSLGLIYLFFSGSKDGEKLFRQLLQARLLSSKVIDQGILNKSSYWYSHISGLALLAGYLKKIRQQPEYLQNLEQQQIFIANQLEKAINQSVQVTQSRINDAHQLHYSIPLLEQNLFTIQQSSTIATTPVMNSRSERFLMSESAHWVGLGPVSVIENQTSRTKPKNSGGSAIQRDTSNKVQVDRFTHHSDTATTIRQYHYKNNNAIAREVLGWTEVELDNEEDEEQERTLQEEIKHEKSDVEQRIISPVEDNYL